METGYAKKKLAYNIKNDAGIFSRWFFLYLNPIFKAGRKVSQILKRKIVFSMLYMAKDFNPHYEINEMPRFHSKRKISRIQQKIIPPMR